MTVNAPVRLTPPPNVTEPEALSCVNCDVPIWMRTPVFSSSFRSCAWKVTSGTPTRPMLVTLALAARYTPTDAPCAVMTNSLATMRPTSRSSMAKPTADVSGLSASLMRPSPLLSRQ